MRQVTYPLRERGPPHSGTTGSAVARPIQTMLRAVRDATCDATSQKILAGLVGFTGTLGAAHATVSIGNWVTLSKIMRKEKPVLPEPFRSCRWQELLADVQLPSPVHRLADERFENAGVEVWLKRDDLIHPDVPGNKWRKLVPNLAAAVGQGHHVLLTFGGAFSNHIRATAAAGRALDLATIGVIRGEEHMPLNPSLAYAAEHGMRLRYLDRETYRRKADPAVIDALRQELGPFYLIPEGGSDELAVRGCAEIPPELPSGFDVVCCPCGTGGTLAGIAGGLAPGQGAIGFSALKGAGYLAGEVAGLQQAAFGAPSGNWQIEHGFHFGGFARRNADLDAFIDRFRVQHAITLEWTYVAKMMYGLCSLSERGYFTPGTRVAAVITGPPGPE